MPLTPTLSSPEPCPDFKLVIASRQGDRDAFASIVARYQGLLCSLAFAATGSLGDSEDLAQDVFVDAWQRLDTLREPAKLRPWLCAILRHKISRWRRAHRTEPVLGAETLEHAEEVPSAEAPALDQAIGQEEQTLLWQALERIPLLYREPLILYYREHRSIEHVAAALELTEETVRQRLTRGRRLLQDHVLRVLETALTRSSPNRLFTLGVLAALPDAGFSAKVTGSTAAAVHGGWLAKSTGFAAILASLSGLISAALNFRANLDQARTPRERRAVVRVTAVFFFGALAWLGAVFLARELALRQPEHRRWLAGLTQFLVLGFVFTFPFSLIRVMHTMRCLRSAERRRRPDCFADPRDRVGAPAGEYRSRWKWLGVPLVHVRFSNPDDGQPPVLGWIAGGDRAVGLLLAWGGLAVAPVSVGACAVGLLSVGSVGFGLISLGTASVGFIALGCVATGVHAGGWMSALGWRSAQSAGFALAGQVAVGPVAFAPHANDGIAREAFAASSGDAWQAFLVIAVTVLCLIPAMLYARAVRQRLGRRAKTFMVSARRPRG